MYVSTNVNCMLNYIHQSLVHRYMTMRVCRLTKSSIKSNDSSKSNCECLQRTIKQQTYTKQTIKSQPLSTIRIQTQTPTCHGSGRSRRRRLNITRYIRYRWRSNGQYTCATTSYTNQWWPRIYICNFGSSTLHIRIFSLWWHNSRNGIRTCCSRRVTNADCAVNWRWSVLDARRQWCEHICSQRWPRVAKPFIWRRDRVRTLVCSRRGQY